MLQLPWSRQLPFGKHHIHISRPVASYNVGICSEIKDMPPVKRKLYSVNKNCDWFICLIIWWNYFLHLLHYVFWSAFPSDTIQAQNLVYCRTDYRLAPSQWETSLQSSTVSHWLGRHLEAALYWTCVHAKPISNTLKHTLHTHKQTGGIYISHMCDDVQMKQVTFIEADLLTVST